jgi:3',5'-cyclic-nucleotide phosphodiesterase
MIYYRLLIVIILLLPAQLWSQQKVKPVFKVIPLGVKGGIDESNLSAYLLAPAGSDEFICLDAGTLHFGIQKALTNGVLKTDTHSFLRKNIKAYFISHPHLDHVAGLIINSPDDSNKSIYGLTPCLDVLKDKYFSWKSWANFGDAGEQPALKKYHYYALDPTVEIPIENTPMTVKAFPLSHVNPNQSTAFLIGLKDQYILYLGDTGDDETEKSNNLQELWKGISDLVKTNKLKAIFIEVSYTNEQPVKQLFGHLTPALLIKELNVLKQLSGPDALKGLPVVITHMKLFEKKEIENLKTQLNKGNDLGVKFRYAEQAIPMTF